MLAPRPTDTERSSRPRNARRRGGGVCYCQHMHTEDVEKALTSLSIYADKRRNLNRMIDDIVLVLRSPDLEDRCAASWQEIADALGVSRQAAWRMYVAPK